MSYNILTYNTIHIFVYGIFDYFCGTITCTSSVISVIKQHMYTTNMPLYNYIGPKNNIGN